ncbi:MAG: phosphoribosylanthranilate isomerase [Pseudomonadota bacterium]
MSGAIRTKICGLTSVAQVDAAARAGATYIGLNFVPQSPRFLATELAQALALAAPLGLAKVGLTVNADDATLDSLTQAVPLDILQLHGGESPERVEEVKRRYGLPVIKAVGVRDETDLPALEAYGAVADQLLVDAKPPRGSTLEGGNGVTFDWRLIAGRRWPVPWLLAGGLTPDNVADAIARTGAVQVDVSSGVESAPGQKDSDLVRRFCEAAQTVSLAAG